jgi:hypothetical protein
MKAIGFAPTALPTARDALGEPIAAERVSEPAGTRRSARHAQLEWRAAHKRAQLQTRLILRLRENHRR